MEKFIPYEKLSEKEKRKLDQAKRQTRGERNPVTRKAVNRKVYDRRKSQDGKRELPPAQSCDFPYKARKQYAFQEARPAPPGKVRWFFVSAQSDTDSQLKTLIQ